MRRWLLAVAIYGLQGVGRGIFESVNKSLTIDWFPGRAPAAFANIIFQNSASTALGYILFPYIPIQASIGMCLCVAVLSIACVYVGDGRKRRERALLR